MNGTALDRASAGRVVLRVHRLRVLLQAYLRACVEAEGDPSRLADGPWKAWPGTDYHRVNVDRAAALAAGDPAPQPSLLALMGL